MPANSSIAKNLRAARAGLGLSLAEVARQAEISVATLSRIETDKQNLDVLLLIKLARVLGIAPAELLGEAADGDHRTVTRHLARMSSKERARVFVDASRRRNGSVDDLLSVVDFLREELAKLQVRSRRRRRS